VSWILFKFFTLSLLVFVPFSIHAEDSTGLQFSAVGDILSTQELGKNRADTRLLEVRGIELLVYGPIDHQFDGMISLAAHQYRGDFFVELHEAFVETSRLVPRWSFRLGQFFIRQGRLNPTHRHDWNFITAPIVQEQFWDNEGIADSGLEVRYLFSLPFYLELSGGVTSGWKFGHTHGFEGNAPKIPTHYSRLETFFEASSTLAAKAGLNYLGRKDSDRKRQHLAGLDFMLKRTRARDRIDLVESETWTRWSKVPESSDLTETGSFIYAQYALTRKLHLGVRADHLQNWGQLNLVGEKKTSSTSSVSLHTGYQVSEFSKFRLEGQRAWQSGATDIRSPEWKLSGQVLFFLGAHPAHEF
jgi:hypothetical protein